MALMPPKAGYPALQPRVTVFGPVCSFFFIWFSLSHIIVCPVQAGAKKGSHEFLFDVRNYVLGTSRLAGHTCFFPSNNQFKENPPFPGEGKMASVTGTIRAAAGHAFGDRSIKRLMLEVNDCSFLASDPSPASPSVNRAVVHVSFHFVNN